MQGLQIIVDREISKYEHMPSHEGIIWVQVQ